jgi:ATP-binding cassette subfamily F protein uup
MSVLLSCQLLSKSYPQRDLFSGITFGISKGERIGLIGPNGAGKSTLLRILSGLEQPDSGTLSVRNHICVSYVPQEPQFEPNLTAEQIVARAVAERPWDDLEKEIAIGRALSQIGMLNPDQPVESLSGGWKKRLALAVALSRKPDLLLLDEPTNHLDIEGILWLEDLLQQDSFAFLVVTHDRYFLEQVARSMIEINRLYADGFLRIDGNYSEFLQRRAEYLEMQQKYEQSLVSKVRREVEWLQQGAKARTTKAKARIQEAERLQDELAIVQTRQLKRETQIDFNISGRKTKELLQVQGISKSLDQRVLFTNLSFRINRGTCLGLVGSNGSGKTTLLRILASESTPDTGSINHTERLQLVFFRQERPPLDMNTSLRRALAPDGDHVMFRGQQLHVASWAWRFGFRSEQLDVKIGLLSGGERARIAIAELMLQPADLLLLDEPTNDLDIETLEVLEQNLLDFPGALVLVTHDRYLLDRVCDVVLALEPGHDPVFVADYHQWREIQKNRRNLRKREQQTQSLERYQQTSAKNRKKLTYLEQKEWEQMEDLILAAELELEAQQNLLDDPDIASDAERLNQCYQLVQQSQNKVEQLYNRWAELEQKTDGQP